MRGGYYTPQIISQFIAKWALRDKSESVLEPSCGDGNILKEVVKRKKELGASSEEILQSTLGIELDPKESEKAKISGAFIENTDFFTYYKERIYNKRKYDIIVGNPPFIRYQNFNNEYREIAFEMLGELGFKPSKLMNIWVPFLILSSYALKEDGRIAMVIPAELFQVNYSAETRKFLSDYFDKITVITFKELVFKDIQQEVIILLGECKSNNKGIQVMELQNANDLSDLTEQSFNNFEIKDLDHTDEKWIKYYLTNEEIHLMRTLRNSDCFINTTELFEINVGVVSGQNDFFILNEEDVKENNLKNSVVNIISKSEQLKGIILKEEDFTQLIQSGKKVFFFSPEDKPIEELNKFEANYIRLGESKNYHTGYKCRIRKRWYVVPKSWKPEGFILRQVNKFPKIIYNDVGALSTDTIHKIRFCDGVSPEYVTAAFLNSFTLALSEITGRSYGGGVLTFEPGEIRKLKIPMNGAERIDFNRINNWILKGDIDKVLEYNDKILLEDSLGMSTEDIMLLRGIWDKLRDRRLNRRK